MLLNSDTLVSFDIHTIVREEIKIPLLFSKCDQFMAGILGQAVPCHENVG